MLRSLLFCSVALCVCAAAADKYAGPKPEKADVPYLIQAGNLIQTEVAEATESHQKKNTIYTVPGASSPAKTPLAEPSFILLSKTVSPETLQLFQFQVVNGARQVVIGKHQAEPFHLSVRNLGQGLYQIDVADTLENGEYALSPTGSNTSFCFAVVP
ncbi:MAG TPA: hypothetical protein VFA04_01495 [Bryobacteraceae bacterium]|nr:hypothetical protein [Bryobacteraceae bacterium]